MCNKHNVSILAEEISVIIQVVFDGQVGKGNKGDTAIDDVYITDGVCTNATVVPPTDSPQVTYPTFRE